MAPAGYLRRLSPDWAGRLPGLTTFVACFQVVILALAVIFWWSGMLPFAMLAAILSLCPSALLRFALFRIDGQWVPNDRTVTFWTGQPLEPIILDLTTALSWVTLGTPMLMDGSIEALALLPFIIVFLFSAVWQLWRCR